MSVKYQAATLTISDGEDSKKLFAERSKLQYNMNALRNNPFRVATLCLGLLCVILVAGLIGQSIRHRKVDQEQQNKLTAIGKEKEDLQETVKVERRERRDIETARKHSEESNSYYSSVVKQLQTNNNILTEETNKLKQIQSQLQESINAFNNEAEQLRASNDHLQSNNNALTKDKDSLQKQYDSVLKVKSKLHEGFNNVTNERDSLQTKFNNLSTSKSELQKGYSKLIKDVEHLVGMYNFSSHEKDKAVSSQKILLDEISKLESDYKNLVKQEETLNQKFRKTMSNYSVSECNNQTAERERLQKNYEDLSEERNRLQLDIERLNTTMHAKRCLSGWRKFENSCYFYSSVKKTWAKAREYCQTKGAELSILTSRQEMRFVNGLLRSSQEVWIGLTDEGVEGRWKWVDGTPMTTSFWGKGQPNSHGGKEQDCVEFWQRALGPGEWNDESCTISQYFLCEI